MFLRREGELKICQSILRRVNGRRPIAGYVYGRIGRGGGRKNCSSLKALSFFPGDGGPFLLGVSGVKRFAVCL